MSSKKNILDIHKFFSKDLLLEDEDITIYFLRCFFGAIIGAFGLGMRDPLFKGSSILISPFGAPYAYFIYYLFHYKYYGLKFIKYLNYIVISTIIFLGVGYISGFLFQWLNDNYGTDFAVLEKPLDEKDIRKRFIANFFVGLAIGFIMFSSLINKDIGLIVGITLSITFLLPLVNAGIEASMGNLNYLKDSLYLFIVNLSGLTLSSMITLFFN